MKWMIAGLLLVSAGCGYRQTKMVACPPEGCTNQFAHQSPEGTVYTPPPPNMPPEEMGSPAPTPAPTEPPPVTP